MSATGTPLASPSADPALPKGRSLLAHLLHALNQPLTGLQCSMEIALATPRRTEQYVSTLRDGLDLTARMRILVQSIRELADQDDVGSGGVFLLDDLLRETLAELHPVAESRNIRLVTAYQPSLPVIADRQFVAALTFRWLESALSLAAEGTEFRVSAAKDTTRAQMAVSWVDGEPPAHSPFSRAELGLLITQTGWERAGAEWVRKRTAGSQSCTVRMPLVLSPLNPPNTHLENQRQENS